MLLLAWQHDGGRGSVGVISDANHRSAREFVSRQNPSVHLYRHFIRFLVVSIISPGHFVFLFRNAITSPLGILADRYSRLRRSPRIGRMTAFRWRLVKILVPVTAVRKKSLHCAL